MPEPIRETIRANAATVDRIVDIAVDFAEHGDPRAAATWLQVAGHFAWMNHPGFHVDHRVEQLVVDLSRSLPSVGGVPRRRDGGAAGSGPRVLIVMTEVYATGGHTRQAERYLRALPGRGHHLAFTRVPEMPVWLADAVEAVGGGTTYLAEGGADLLTAAARLRVLAAGFDAVLSLVHPFDAVPGLAFGDAPEIPYAIVSHADHPFWVGSSRARIVVDFRETGRDITLGRRLVAPERTCIVPLPVPTETGRLDRAAARAGIGATDDMLMLLTVGSTMKFGADEHADFAELTNAVLLANPAAHLVVVGSPGTNGWHTPAELANRIHHLGYVDLAQLFPAVDVYLDSYPVSGGYTVLEAASHGLPVVTLVPETAEAKWFFKGDAPGLTESRIVASTAGDYVALVNELLAVPEARIGAGRQAAAEVVSEHGDVSVRRHLSRLLQRLAEVGPVDGAFDLTPPPPTGLDDALQRWNERGGITTPLESCLAIQQVTLDPAGRWQTMNGPTIREAAGIVSGQLSVVVLTSGGVDELVATLQSLLDGLGAEHRLEVVVVDHGSSDGTAEVLRSLAGDVSSVWVDGRDPEGAAWGNGLNSTSGDLAVLVTAGTTPSSERFGALLSELARRPEVDIVTMPVPAGVAGRLAAVRPGRYLRRTRPVEAIVEPDRQLR